MKETKETKLHIRHDFHSKKQVQQIQQNMLNQISPSVLTIDSIANAYSAFNHQLDLFFWHSKRHLREILKVLFPNLETQTGLATDMNVPNFYSCLCKKHITNILPDLLQFFRQFNKSKVQRKNSVKITKCYETFLIVISHKYQLLIQLIMLEDIMPQKH